MIFFLKKTSALKNHLIWLESFGVPLNFVSEATCLNLVPALPAKKEKEEEEKTAESQSQVRGKF